MKIVIVVNSDGIETVRVVASTTEELIEGEALLQKILHPLETIHSISRPETGGKHMEEIKSILCGVLKS